jgi:CRP-like cAMP-binding protein
MASVAEMQDNELLAGLKEAEVRRIRDDFESVSLQPNDVLHEVDVPIEQVWFPRSGVLSLVNVMEDQVVIEVATIGNEGMLGVSILLGADRTASRGLCQVPSDSLRIETDRFLELADENPGLRRMCLLYTQALMTQIAQSSACNRAHPVEKRAARWLLQTHDRVGQDSFYLTQEFLAQMLGVRRPTVSVAAAMLQERGLIDYVRGHIAILDREGLEAASCECYGIIQREFEQLLRTASADPRARARRR